MGCILCGGVFLLRIRARKADEHCTQPQKDSLHIISCSVRPRRIVRSILLPSDHFAGSEMKMIHMLCWSLLLVAATFAQRPSEEAHALIGIWRVVEFADFDKDGKRQYWYGEHPRGYFVYDS